MVRRREFTLRQTGLSVIIKQGGITNQGTDAVVSAANKKLQDGSGVNGAILRAAGRGLLRDCKRLPVIDRSGTRLATGTAMLQRGYNLSKFLIPAVGPRYINYSEQDARRLLRSAYSQALSIAGAKSDISSVSLPALSCGAYGFPPEKSAEILMEELVDQSRREVALKKVKVVLRSEENV